ncbi:conserved hypothetical protein [Paecilomyces variotii No. 5]|uniref:Uncharacterized protein n=1 Tax=Byssochlamys spectabilis (strain No. 5 / NBRC 109023) TaxID=1356009 RepID=V5G2T2_BYSSN|nr:conserved hypothetical protein [Paecilomyces variotii No. 5]
MSTSGTKFQVISRSDYTEQHIVTAPPLSTPLAPSSVRARPSVLSLIVNTLNCASHPELKIGWWDVHLLPENTPAPFDDVNKYGRIGVWGWATVTESTIDGILPGARLYGFFPVATLPVDLQLRPTGAAGIYRETSPFRAQAMRIYNTYEVHSPHTIGDETSQALDAIAKPTFRLGFLLERYCFNPTQCIHPADPDLAWTPGDADLTDTIVVLASATSKTALGFAYMLARREQEKQPAHVVALTSSTSASFAANTGWYSDIVTYENAEQVALIGTRGRRVVIIEFGGRQESAARAYRSVKEQGSRSVLFLGVGGEVKKDAFKYTPEAVSAMMQQGIVLLNTGSINEMAEATLGEEGETKLNEEFYASWSDFKKNGFPGMNIHWGRGIEEYAKAYEKMCNGEVKADTGLVFKMEE